MKLELASSVQPTGRTLPRLQPGVPAARLQRQSPRSEYPALLLDLGVEPKIMETPIFNR